MRGRIDQLTDPDPTQSIDVFPEIVNCDRSRETKGNWQFSPKPVASELIPFFPGGTGGADPKTK